MVPLFEMVTMMFQRNPERERERERERCLIMLTKRWG